MWREVSRDESGRSGRNRNRNSVKRKRNAEQRRRQCVPADRSTARKRTSSRYGNRWRYGGAVWGIVFYCNHHQHYSPNSRPQRRRRSAAPISLRSSGQRTETGLREFIISANYLGQLASRRLVQRLNSHDDDDAVSHILFGAIKHVFPATTPRRNGKENTRRRYANPLRRPLADGVNDGTEWRRRRPHSRHLSSTCRLVFILSFLFAKRHMWSVAKSTDNSMESMDCSTPNVPRPPQRFALASSTNAREKCKKNAAVHHVDVHVDARNAEPAAKDLHWKTHR